MRLAISIAAVVFAACASTSPPPCTLPPGHVIRWGTWLDSLGRLEGYQLAWNGTVTRYQQSIQSGQLRILDTLTVRIEPQTHCAVATDLRNAFVQHQTYVVIGPVSHFVELATPSATARAVWDARFETYGSRHFRAIFRWLNHLVGNDEAAHR
ncbi:MAG: hypothetical protein KatS3mg038_0001 [Candidatus Kapaibacterium sp.]|nr:MAG: hypothetical protein KatS3mg038_0001 [Candidatus Kapabacteria bacterium]